MNYKHIKRMADLASIYQDNKDFLKMVTPDSWFGNENNHEQQLPSSIIPSNPIINHNTDMASAIAYNIKTEPLYKKYESDIKRILKTSADWKSTEFAKAVYDWQKNNGITGKLIDGKFGPITMNKMGTLDSELNKTYGVHSMTPWEPDGSIKLRLTGYWPFTARPDERKMEGPPIGAAAWRGKRVVDPDTGKRAALHTVEQHIQDPINHPFVSLAGDDAIFDFGQIIVIPWTGNHNIIGKVIDTGGHFRGAGKIYRAAGYEPIDVCVNSSKTIVPKLVIARLVGGILDKSSIMQPNISAPNESSIAKLKVINRIKNAEKKAKKIISGI